MNIEQIVSIVSALIALFSAVFAYRALKISERNHGVELVTQLYSTYQSEKMLKDTQIAWSIYYEIWERDSSSPATARENVNRGIAVNEYASDEYFDQLNPESEEYQAVHNLISFWNYLRLLVKRKALLKEDITAFTTPKILGVLYPLERSFYKKFDLVWEPEKSLKWLYDELNIVE